MMNVRLALLLAALAPAPLLAQAKPPEGSVIEQPLRDVNLKGDDIPDLLQRVARNPYSREGTRSCRTVTQQIRDLDAILGRDVDVPLAKDEDPTERIANTALRDAVNSLIPGRGIIREITGAAGRQRRAAAAYYAGGLRRAFLKGVASARGCQLPPPPPLPTKESRDEDKGNDAKK